MSGCAGMGAGAWFWRLGPCDRRENLGVAITRAIAVGQGWRFAVLADAIVLPALRPAPSGALLGAGGVGFIAARSRPLPVTARVMQVR